MGAEPERLSVARGKQMCLPLEEQAKRCPTAQSKEQGEEGAGGTVQRKGEKVPNAKSNKERKSISALSPRASKASAPGVKREESKAAPACTDEKSKERESRSLCPKKQEKVSSARSDEGRRSRAAPALHQS